MLCCTLYIAVWTVVRNMYTDEKLYTIRNCVYAHKVANALDTKVNNLNVKRTVYLVCTSRC